MCNGGSIKYVYTVVYTSSLNINLIMIANYFCDICEISFQFKSKYERHVLTLAHKRKVMVHGIMNKPCHGAEDNHDAELSSELLLLQCDDNFENEESDFQKGVSSDEDSLCDNQVYPYSLYITVLMP
jgi:hypothetical protein